MRVFVSLLLILSAPYSSAEDIHVEEFLNKDQINPAGNVCFDKNEIDQLAIFKKTCDKHKEELDLFQGQYQKCMNGEMCEELATNSRIVYWGSVIMALGLGYALGLRGGNR